MYEEERIGMEEMAAQAEADAMAQWEYEQYKDAFEAESARAEADAIYEETTMDFTTKDSGKREQFESGMVRDTQDGKLRFDLAFDGPLFWSLFDGRPCGLLVRAMQRWYEEGGVKNAAEVIWQMSEYEKVSVMTIVERYSALMMRGAVKYAEKNWMLAEGEAEFKRFGASACRHFKQYINNETDEDHGAAVFFNLNGAEYVSGKVKAGLGLPF